MSDVVEESPISLRADSLAALASFLAERAAAVAASVREAEDTGATLLTTEDWELSQFWYDESTARFLAAEVSRCAAEALSVEVSACGSVTTGDDVSAPPIIAAFVSSPSAFKAFRAAGGAPGVRGVLLEFDARFGVFGEDFVHFDYNTPENLRIDAPFLTDSVDVFLIDPPFLNAECLTGFAAALLLMGRKGGASPRILLASGAVMLRPARKLLGLRPTRTAIKHAAGRLSNPFALFSNYMRPELGGWDEEAEASAEKGV